MNSKILSSSPVRFALASVAVFASCISSTMAQDPFAEFANQGLVGVGRVPANSFDRVRPHRNQDTLGGIFSGMYFDASTLRIGGGNSKKATSYEGTLFALPDRGFGDGLQDFRPRFHEFTIDITPYYGSGPAPQDQIEFRLRDTVLLTYYDGTNFTGFDPNPANTLFPLSFAGGLTVGTVTTPASLGEGRASIDSEGIVKMSDGTFFVSDEYGPLIYHFTRSGELLETISPPAALLPRAGANFGSRTNDFGASTISGGSPISGRRDNRGLEGLTVTPDEMRLVAFLQSPTIQDGGSGVNTRILFFDIEPSSVTRGRVVAEYVYVLSVTDQTAANPTEGKKATAVSEIRAVNDHQFLVLDRDGYGRGKTDPGLDTLVPQYKKVVLVDTTAATNLAGTGFDLEKGAPGQISLPSGALPPELGITPVAKKEFVDLLDMTQLAKFGLNVRSHAASDNNTITEKWEGLAIVPLNDPAAPDDYLLLVGNDNDFKASTVVHNGQVVGTNAVTLDSIVLAWRVTLPGYQGNLADGGK
jgi:hypothetical protein